MWPHVQPLPGAVKLVKHLYKHGIPIGIATGTRRRNLQLKTGHLSELMECFGDRIVCADDGKLGPGRGKPCPDIFLIAARDLLGQRVGSAEQQEANEEEKGQRSKGLVFEDAIPGMQAGKRAGMHGKLTLC